MSIVAIISSPRKNKNSATIVEAMIEGAKKNGKDVKVYHLNSLSHARGCQACMGCKAAGKCVIKDDHTEILDAIREAEGLIVSTPVYFGEACGQFRLLQDRFYSFLGPNFVPNIAPGKKCAVVITCGGGEAGAKALADKIEGAMAGMLKFVPVGKIVYADGNNPEKAAAKNSAVLEEAKAIGKKL